MYRCTHTAAKNRAELPTQAFQLLTHPPEPTIAFRVGFNQKPPLHPQTITHTSSISTNADLLAGKHHAHSLYICAVLIPGQVWTVCG